MAQAWPGGSVAWRRDINSSWPKLGPVGQLHGDETQTAHGPSLARWVSCMETRHKQLMAQAWPGGSVAWRRDINSSWPKLGPVGQLHGDET